MTLRLLYIHTTDISGNDTSSTFVINNALSLARNGAKVKLWVVRRTKDKAEDLIMSRYGLTELPENLSVQAIHLKGKSHFRFYLFAFWAAPKIPKDTIVITRCHAVLPYLMLFARISNKIFFETHDYFFDLSKRLDINPRRREKKSRIERKFFPKLTGMICLNTYQKELYEDVIDIPIQVFTTGLERVHVHEKGTSNQIVYVGSVNKRLGLDKIVGLTKQMPDYNFMIIGGKNQEDIDLIKSYYDGGVLPDNLTVTGWVDKKQLDQLLREAVVGLLPLSDTFFNQYLTVPLKVFDYMAYGIITVAPAYPSCEFLLENERYGFLIDWEDTEGVMKILQKIMKDKERQRSMRSSIFQAAREMTWDNRAKQQIEYFKNLK